MSDYRNYSKVLSVSYGDSYGRILKLECGHEVYRYGKVAPKKVKCERCLLTKRAADESESCVCKKPIVEKGFCFVCQSPVSSRR